MFGLNSEQVLACRVANFIGSSVPGIADKWPGIDMDVFCQFLCRMDHFPAPSNSSWESLFKRVQAIQDISITLPRLKDCGDMDSPNGIDDAMAESAKYRPSLIKIHQIVSTAVKANKLFEVYFYGSLALGWISTKNGYSCRSEKSISQQLDVLNICMRDQRVQLARLGVSVPSPLSTLQSIDTGCDNINADDEADTIIDSDPDDEAKRTTRADG
ncbi:hypothetical protein HJFPF1_13570 [Paramyrothecium foliicola]|nr:hypothetical protein HJFPF1_13570 [Paramyrothecium foliicola]